MDATEEAEPPVPEEPEVPEPSEPVVIKKRGRPKGSLNKKTIKKTIDVDFASEEVLGETPAPSTFGGNEMKRKAKKLKAPPPTSEL